MSSLNGVVAAGIDVHQKTGGRGAAEQHATGPGPCYWVLRDHTVWPAAISGVFAAARRHPCSHGIDSTILATSMDGSYTWNRSIGPRGTWPRWKKPWPPPNERITMRSHVYVRSPASVPVRRSRLWRKSGPPPPLASAGKLASWVGVCPGRQESAGVSTSNRSPKGNHTLRRVLSQIAWAAIAGPNCCCHRLAPEEPFSSVSSTHSGFCILCSVFCILLSLKLALQNRQQLRKLAVEGEYAFEAIFHGFSVSGIWDTIQARRTPRGGR